MCRPARPVCPTGRVGLGRHTGLERSAEQILTTTFGFHPLAVRDSANRNPVPKIHRYDDHLFLVLHAPQPGAGGHVHYVELDHFVGIDTW